MDYITNLATTSDEIVYDETDDHNLRYIGKDPNNYVSFNGELWRIIGVMSNVEDENSVIEPRVKLIRNESIGVYSWDNNTYESDFWNTSSMKNVLNSGAYYNRNKGQCPKGSDNKTVECDFTDIGLMNEAKTMIDKVKWFQEKSIYANMIINYKKIGNGLIDYVGLINVSDYGLATNGYGSVTRESCISSWNSSCGRKDWLFTITDYWTISTTDLYNEYVYIVESSGDTTYKNVYDSYNVIPVVYLNTNIKINGGTGTVSDPFQLSD